ncbi:ribonuclease III [Prochlorothrix hollandica]|nr:ribonuclease III [Prochlorothrix hollandica]
MSKLPTFRNPDLFAQSVTHASCDSTGNGGATIGQGLLLPLVMEEMSLIHEPTHYFNNVIPPNNERLEFLGDAVLNFLAGEFLYKRYPQKTEGELTPLRSALVDERQLSAFAKTLELGQYLRLGKSAENQGGRNNSKILSSTFEAVVGAYFLDQNSDMDTVKSFVWPLFESVVDHQVIMAVQANYKSRLQEWIQSHYPCGQLPKYEVVAEKGPAHAKTFTVVVRVGDRVCGEGEGRSKQAAEKVAAQMALAELGELP